MTKIYKINGKQIINDWTKTSPAQVMEQLLEALSDKEEKCNWKPDGTNTEKCFKCDKWKYWYEEQTTPCQPKQEECKNCPHDITPTFTDKDLVNMPKQSTSLRLAIELNIDRCFNDPAYSLDKTADKIISLFKTHLLEEIEKKKLGGHQDEMKHIYANGFDDSIENIKNLIKNI